MLFVSYNFGTKVTLFYVALFNFPFCKDQLPEFTDYLSDFLKLLMPKKESIYLLGYLTDKCFDKPG